MSVDIAASRYALIAEARGNWVREQQMEAAQTGKAAQPVPSDSELIIDEPPLAQEIEQIDSQQDQPGNSAQGENTTTSSSERNTGSTASESQTSAGTSRSGTTSSSDTYGKNVMNLLA
jgi:hypothetical protein